MAQELGGDCCDYRTEWEQETRFVEAAFLASPFFSSLTTRAGAIQKQLQPNDSSSSLWEMKMKQELLSLLALFAP